MQKTLENILKSEIDPAFAKRARFIFEEIEKEKPQKVLDAGCGRGFYVNSLTNFEFIKEIHGFDINEKYLAIAKKNIDDKQKVILQKSSIYKLPYPDNYFDFIICSEVLEHLQDDKKGLKELKRVLKKSGTLVITVPNKNFPFLWDPLNWILMKLFNTHINKNIWWLAGIWADHERLYSLKEITNLIKNSDLKIEKAEQLIRWCWPFSHFLLYAIGKNLVETVGLKNFNRFNFAKKSYISEFIAKVCALPSNLLDSRVKIKPTVNIILLLKAL